MTLLCPLSLMVMVCPCPQLAQPGYSFETGEKLPGLQVLMADVDPTKAAAYQADSKVFLDLYVKQTIPHTPKGLAYPYHVSF